MEHYDLLLVTEEEKQFLEPIDGVMIVPIDGMMVFQTNAEIGIHQYNAEGTWDYIGGRPPRR